MTSAQSSLPILVLADDGTDPSTRAWDWVRSQSWPDWSIEAVTADEEDIVWGEPAQTEPWTPTWNRDPGDIRGNEVHFLRSHVDPRAMLAGREDAQLIVVGLRTESHLEALVSGSTTEWLLHHPPAPLVVAINTNPVRSVLICVDGSAHALAALNAFANLPLSAEASAVTVLAVDDGRANANDAIEDAAAQLAPNDIEAQRVVVPGSPTQAILDYVVAHNPDMVVLGTRGLTGLKRLRLGSTAAAVVRSAKTTCLVASDGSDPDQV